MIQTVYIPRTGGGRWEVSQARSGAVYYRVEGADPFSWRLVPGGQAAGLKTLKAYA